MMNFFKQKAKELVTGASRCIQKLLRTCLPPPTPLSYKPVQRVWTTGSPYSNLPDVRDIKNLVHNKRQELFGVLGENRGLCVYESQVKAWDYALVYADADWRQGQQLREALKRSSNDIEVAGPWCIKLGNQILNTWESLLKNATVVVVLVSRNLYRERILNVCFPELFSGEMMKPVVPVFLEKVGVHEIANELRPITTRQGVDLYHLGIDATARELTRMSSFVPRCLRELDNIDCLLQDIHLHSDNYFEVIPTVTPEVSRGSGPLL